MAEYRLSEIVGGGYDEFWTSRHFYRLVKGAKGSKKSKTAALWYVYHLKKYPLANLLVVRKVASTLRNSCFTDIQWAMEQFGCLHEWQISVSTMEMVHKETKQKIIFRGLDKAEKLASIAVLRGILCWVWFEEMFEITDEQEFEKIQMSIRGRIPPGSGLWKQITGTFNPWSEHTWIKTRFFDNPSKNVFTDTTTYLDNEFLDEVDVQRYEDLRIYNPRAARVICDGDWGIAEGLIYENWEMLDFDVDKVLEEHPKAVVSYGLDFGYSISYNAFVAVIFNLRTRELWVFDEMYERGMPDIELAKRITNMGYGKEAIIADSANPKSIFELQQGYHEQVIMDDGQVRYDFWQLPNIRSALKGGDSVMNGIRRLQSFKMYIHPKCVNTMMELRNYCYDQDTDGNYLDKPIKDFDHCLVAGTMVLTDHGQVPIEDIQVGDMVMTHLGYMPVEAAGITQLEAEIWRLECEDGTVLEGTGNHPVVTMDGLKYIRDITDGDEVIKWQEREGPENLQILRALSNMMDTNGTDIQTPRRETPRCTTDPISTVKSCYSTDISGRSTTDPSPKGTRSIISMGTPSTIVYPTSNASLSRSMLQSILGTMSTEQQSETVCAETAPLRMHAGSGTDPRRDTDGMSSTGTGSQRRSSPVVTPASTVARYSRLNLTAQSSSAPIDVELLLEGHQESITRTVFVKCVARYSPSTSTANRVSAPSPAPMCAGTELSVMEEVARNVAPVRVKSVEITGRREVVYDLTVAVSHDFFANNLITPNCLDALRYSGEKVFIKSTGLVLEAKGGDGPAEYTQRSKRVVAAYGR